MFNWFKPKAADKDVAKRWRDAVTGAARNPEPFLREWVTDTVYGRFNMVALVATLAMRRMRALGGEGRALSSALSELLFSDFDHSLRENGVGDSSIARRIRKMGEEFFGLAKAVDEALDAGGPKQALTEVLQRNVQKDAEKAQALAVYLIDLNVTVEDLSDAQVLAGPDAL
ncbi:MAG: ubiquinol-cytochrome C chaperone [Henriciella sp.]|nr:ubiquinol-cytochrome C chaperone [Henriciella sp.]